MTPHRPSRHTPHTFRGPTGSSTEGSKGKVRMTPPNPSRHTHSHVSWPRRELHRRLHWEGSHGTTAPKLGHLSH
eukprot:4742814-Pyramimonas_sp.AAC.1